MHTLKAALESTTAHGLPRTVSGKPIYVRVGWLLLYLAMLGLFLKGFSDFIIKLQAQQVTSTLEANQVEFQFPDLYVCLENPISSSYSSQIDNKMVNSALSSGLYHLYADYMAMGKDDLTARSYIKNLSGLLPQSAPYTFLADKLGHRAEQTVIESYAIYKHDSGLPGYEALQPQAYYDPNFLRCQKWKLSSDLQKKISRGGSNSGLILTLFVDTGFPAVRIDSGVFIFGAPIPLSDWPLSELSLISTDRRSGARVFLTQPGEIPSDFVKSFSLDAAKYHTVLIGMTQHVYKEGQFDDCLSESADVQFVNFYDQTPSNYSYSYSYCYYYEYHRQYQSIINSSGLQSPLPWPLRGKPFAYNFSVVSIADLMRLESNASIVQRVNRIEVEAQKFCKTKRPCSLMDYSISISSADWPTQSSAESFLQTSVKLAQLNAQAKNQSVPALDYLLNNYSTSDFASYVGSNLLKVHFKPERVFCDRVTFSKDYRLSDFISDVGGIMGVYLGMSLLTLCELLELVHDVAFGRKSRVTSLQNNDDLSEEVKATGT